MILATLVAAAAVVQTGYEVVHEFTGPMPTGVTVSKSGRIFVCFPRWGDPVKSTVVELRDGKQFAYPSVEMQPFGGGPAMQRFVSVQSVVVDPSDRLWALDTGSVQMGPVKPGGAKLVCINLANKKVERVITFPENVALKTSYLNDVRFDLESGSKGFAYITDSSVSGPNAIVVVDLDTGRSWRRLHEHHSVKAEPGFVPTVEGYGLKRRPKAGIEKPINIGADGIAISPDGETLYYCPLSSRRLYSVSTAALRDETGSEAAVAGTVRDLGAKGAADGLEMDSNGRFYTTDYEKAQVRRGQPGEQLSTFIKLPKRLWPDTLSVAADGYLYLMTNELHRGKAYHRGKDLRTQRYLLVRKKMD